MTSVHRILSKNESVKQLSKGGLFKAVVVMPDVSFESQERKEKVFLVIRRHPIMFINAILKSFFYFILGLLIIGLLVTQGADMGLYLTPGLVLSMLLLNTAILIVSVWYGYVKWYFNLFMATNLRIVDVDFVNILDSRWSEAKLANIEDVSVSTPGFWSVFFNMGSLFVQTAGSKSEFEIRNVPKPLKVQDIIMDLATAVKTHKGFTGKSNLSSKKK